MLTPEDRAALARLRASMERDPFTDPVALLDKSLVLYLLDMLYRAYPSLYAQPVSPAAPLVTGAMPVVHKRRRGQPDPQGSVFVGRPTIFGNPFRLGIDGDRAACVRMHAAYLAQVLTVKPWFLDALRGKDLVCWCHDPHEDGPACHADILLALANRSEEVRT